MGDLSDQFAGWRDVCDRAAKAQLALTDAEVQSCLHGRPEPSPEERANVARLQAECTAVFRALLARMKDRAEALRHARSDPRGDDQ